MGWSNEVLSRDNLAGPGTRGLSQSLRETIELLSGELLTELSTGFYDLPRLKCNGEPNVICFIVAFFHFYFSDTDFSLNLQNIFLKYLPVFYNIHLEKSMCQNFDLTFSFYFRL